MLIDVTKDNYEQEVLESHVPVLVDFWGPRCPNCLALMPAVEQLQEKYKNRLKIVKLDASTNRRMCMNLKVMSLPTFLMMKEGQEVDRITGELTAEQLKQKIENLMHQ